jgi:hypothetical protein
MGEVLEPLVETMEPIQATDANGPSYPGAAVDCLTMNSHFSHSLVYEEGAILMYIHVDAPTVCLAIIFGTGIEKSNE